MNCGWMPSIDVSLIGPKSCHLKLEIIFQDNDHPKMRTDRIGSLKKFLYHFGPRVGGDVVVFWRQTAHHVAHATTGEIRDVTTLAQARSDFARSFFHRRKFHLGHCSRFIAQSATRVDSMVGTSRCEVSPRRPQRAVPTQRASLSRTNE